MGSSVLLERTHQQLAAHVHASVWRKKVEQGNALATFVQARRHVPPFFPAARLA